MKKAFQMLEFSDDEINRGYSGLEGPTSPRIVTSKQHSKHTWMRPIVLAIHSFINIPSSPSCPFTSWSEILLEAPFHESFLGNNI
jgi:hypothetical protein